MTVDEILTHGDGEYHSRSGLVVYRRADGSWWSTCGAVKYTPDQMRLLIERDQHRDECPGLWYCKNHPVLRVVGSRIFRGGMHHILSKKDDYYVERGSDGGVDYTYLRDAVDAARALAVGE